MTPLVNDEERSEPRVLRTRSWTATLLLGLCIAAAAEGVSAQQSAPAVGLPARAPGYEHYYRNEDKVAAFATRWGYADGWRDGTHDRELGRNPAPAEQDRYKLAPDHGLHAAIPRATYKSLYRTAYLHGYERGSTSPDKDLPNPH